MVEKDVYHAKLRKCLGQVVYLKNLEKVHGVGNMHESSTLTRGFCLIRTRPDQTGPD